MRLPHDQQAARELVERCERGCDLVGVVPEIIDDGDVLRRADDFKSPADANEVHQREGCFAQSEARIREASGRLAEALSKR